MKAEEETYRHPATQRRKGVRGLGGSFVVAVDMGTPMVFEWPHERDGWYHDILLQLVTATRDGLHPKHMFPRLNL